MMPETESPWRLKYCWQCGEALEHGGAFCHYCGADISPAEQPQTEEEIIFQTKPSFYQAGKAHTFAAILSLLSAAGFGYFGGGFGAVLLTTGFFFLFPLYRQFQRRRTLFTLTNARLRIETGLLSRTVRNIPLSSVYDVTARASILKRIFRVGDVLIDSAATAGKIRLKNVRNPRKFTDLILTQLHRRNLTNRES